MATGGLKNAVCKFKATRSPKNKGLMPKCGSNGIKIGMKITMISVHSKGQPSKKITTYAIKLEMASF